MKTLFTYLLLLFCTSMFAQDLEEGLIGHWLMNSDEDMIDQSSTGQDGYIDSGLLTTDRFGVEDEAVVFDGQFEYAVIGNAYDDVTTIENATFSISLWLKTADIIPDLGPIMCKYAHTGCGEVERQWALLIGASEGIRFYYASTPDNLNYRSVSTLNLVANELETWYHIVATYDGSINTNDGLDRVQIYVDNELQEDTLNFSIGDLGPLITEGNAPIGMMSYVDSNDDQCGQYNVAGALDDVRFYDRVLLDSEVALLYTEGMVGVNEQAAFDASFNLYPSIIENAYFNLSSEKEYDNIRIEVFSSQGMLVQREFISHFSGQQKIALKNSAAGTYIVQVRSQDGLQSMKRVVVR